MPTLTLPSPGKNSNSATVLRWRKKPGDPIRQGDILLEVENDEGLMEVASNIEGHLAEILAKPGQTLAAGGLLAKINSNGVASAAPAAPASASPIQNPKSPIQNPPMSTKSPTGPVTPVLMPKAGQSMEEGVIVKWNVQPGAIVKKGDILFEIETDKATMEVESTDAGRLARIVVPEGAAIAVLQPVAFLADNDSDVDAYLNSQAGGQPATAPVGGSSPASLPIAASVAAPSAPAAVTDSGRVKASPAARKIATERGIDLSAVGQGTGPGGRILSTDVPATAPARAAASVPAAAPSAAATPVSSADLPPGVVRKRMSSMRKAIARNLTISKTTIPHFYVSARVNAGALMSFYKSQKAKYPCSVNDVVVMACAKTIMEFPAFHSRVDGDSILEFPSANIGIAVGLDDGLVVPVLVNAEKFTLEQLGGETRRLANLARTGKIENMGQGVFTISNMGMFGVDEFTAIVNPPEAAILAVGAVREDVIVRDGAIKAGQIMNITLSADHRLIDGALGAQFMGRLRTLLENPIQLIA